MNSNDKVKYFPFAPGIPWRLKHGKYIVPELASSLWQEYIQNKNIVVVCFGGLVETYFSFAILQSINYISPGAKLFWAGPQRFRKLCEMHGMAKYRSDFDSEVLSGFPTPIFFDKNSTVYFNCLNNYFNIKTYYGTKGYPDRRALSRQVVEKSLIPWDNKFLPSFGSSAPSKELEDWIKLGRWVTSKPVLIIPEKTTYSLHLQDCLAWSPMQVKALGAMLKYKSINTLIFTDQPGKYYDPGLHILPIKLEHLWHFLPLARAVLSADIDFLFIANCMSSAKLFTTRSKHQFDLRQNNRFFDFSSEIYKMRRLTPSYVFDRIIGIS